MKILKDIFLFILYDINCSKEDFIHAANQTSKLNSYFTLMHMICKIIFTFIAIAVLLLIFICLLMLVLSFIIDCPIMLLPIFVIICLPYIVMLFFKKRKDKGKIK